MTLSQRYKAVNIMTKTLHLTSYEGVSLSREHSYCSMAQVKVVHVKLSVPVYPFIDLSISHLKSIHSIIEVTFIFKKLYFSIYNVLNFS